MKKCFVISPIGEAESDTRKRSDKVLKYIIKPVLEKLDYEVKRADDIDRPGMITSQIIQCILEYDLVLADLTETNPNVFYELGIRHSIKKPLIQIMQEGDRIPFDVAGQRTIIFNLNDIESAESAKQNIEAQVNAINQPDYIVETPVSITSDLSKLTSSSDPNQKAMGEILGAVSDLRNDVSKIDSQKHCVFASDFSESFAKQIDNSLAKSLNNYEYGMRNRRRIDPFFMKEVWRYEKDSKASAAMLLMVFSAYKEIAPWVYEMGLEIYRSIRDGKYSKAKSLSREIRGIAKYMMHSELMELNSYSKKEMMMLVEELPYFLDKSLNSIIEMERMTKSENKENDES